MADGTPVSDEKIQRRRIPIETYKARSIANIQQLTLREGHNTPRSRENSAFENLGHIIRGSCFRYRIPNIDCEVTGPDSATVEFAISNRGLDPETIKLRLKTGRKTLIPGGASACLTEIKENPDGPCIFITFERA
jgi:hypothetical protein